MSLPWPWRSRRSSERTTVPASPRVLTFWSPVSAGKTVLAAATAGALSQGGSKVALVDLDSWTPTHSRVDSNLDAVAADVMCGTFDPVRTAASLHRLAHPGLYALSGAENPLRAELLSRDHYMALISALTAAYDVVVLDTSRHLSVVATLAALDAADLVALPVAPQAYAVRHLSRYLTLLEDEFGLDLATRGRTILNHPFATAEMSRAHLDGLLRHRIVAEIPFRPEWAAWHGEEWMAPLSTAQLTAMLGASPLSSGGPAPSPLEEGVYASR